MRELLKKFVLPIFFLVLLPAGVSADTIVVGTTSGPCQLTPVEVHLGEHPVFGPCLFPGAPGFAPPSAVHGSEIIVGPNFYLHRHTPLVFTGGMNVRTVFTPPHTIMSNPDFSPAGSEVRIRLFLNGIVNFFGEGPATVDIDFTGMYNGSMLNIHRSISRGMGGEIHETEFGRATAADGAAAVSILSITIDGPGSFVSLGSPEFEGVAVPEPTTLLLLSTGLSGVIAAVRRRRKGDKGKVT